MRRRNYFLVGGSILVLLFNYFTDPNGGALTATWLAGLATPVVAVWFSYLTRHALFDYLDMEELWEKAKESSIGAAITFAGICIVVFGLLGLFGGAARAEGISTTIPTKAHIHMSTVIAEQTRLWPNHPKGI